MSLGRGPKLTFRGFSQNTPVFMVFCSVATQTPNLKATTGYIDQPLALALATELCEEGPQIIIFYIGRFGRGFQDRLHLGEVVLHRLCE